MFPSQKKILDILRNRPATSQELVNMTGLSPDSIRGRISELRTRFNFNIKKIDGKYHLQDGNKDIESVIAYIASHNQYGLKIKISKLMDELDMNREIIDKILSTLYHRKQLFQVSKDVIIIYNI